MPEPRLSPSFYGASFTSSLGGARDIEEVLNSHISSYDSLVRGQNPGRLPSFLDEAPPRPRVHDKRPKWKGDGRGDFAPPALVWGEVARSEAPGVEAPPPEGRWGATLSLIGCGLTAFYVLIGGRTDSGLPSFMEVFDPLHLRWVHAEDVGISMLGEPPSARVGHTSVVVGRHVLLVFGGRSRGGLSDELLALVQHKAPTSVDARCCSLSWTRPPAVADAGSPSARAHQAVAEIGMAMFLLGGEDMVEVPERKASAFGSAALLPPLHHRAEVRARRARARCSALRAHPTAAPGAAPTPCRAHDRRAGAPSSCALALTSRLSAPPPRAPSLFAMLPHAIATPLLA